MPLELSFLARPHCRVSFPRPDELHVVTEPTTYGESARYSAFDGLSVDDVEGEPESSIEFDPRDFLEVADGFGIEILDRHRDDVVATDDASFGQTLLWTDSDFGADASDRPGDRCTGDRGRHGDGCVTSENANRATACWSTEVGPEDVVACYHSGAVCAATRRADWTSAGSGG